MTIMDIFEAHQFEPTSYKVRVASCSCGGWMDDHAPVHQAKHFEGHRRHLAQVLDQHMQEREAQMRQLIRDMVDPDPCWFDHHGGCQAHGYLSLKPGELCPHMEAKQLLGGESSDGR